MEIGPQVLVGVAGYWLSPTHESGLGVLARAQVVATHTVLETGQGQFAAFPSGRVNTFTPELQGRLMRKWLVRQNPTRSSQSVDFNDPAVTNTVKEFLKIWEYVGRHPETSEVLHLVNHAHQPRAELLFDQLTDARKRMVGTSSPVFHIRPVTEFLNLQQRAWLTSSVEQAKFIEREKTALKIAQNPILQFLAADLLPDAIKRRIEDRFVSKFPSES